MKVDAYVKRKSVLEETIQKEYSLVLGQCTKMMKSKLKHSTGCSKSFTKFDVLELLKITKSNKFKSGYQKYSPIFLHQENINKSIIYQDNIDNVDYYKNATIWWTWHLHSMYRYMTKISLI